MCTGRTHGVHAEPTTFGFKMLGHLLELQRAEASFKEASQQACVVKLSGAVGTYASLGNKVEDKVCKFLKLPSEDLATQVVPRDRLSRLIFSLSLLGSCLERLAVELRHLQRTEVSEAMEGFKKGQTGSSAMPHKKNPISAENITGLSRMLRSYVQPSLENISLWHERDISHSSVERVIVPDAFILSHYLLSRTEELLKNLQIDKTKMKENLMLSKGSVFSSQVLNSLVAKGLSRKEAYKLVQELSHKMKKSEDLKSLLMKNAKVKKYLNQKDINEIFSGKKHLQSIESHINKVLKKV